LPRGRFDAAPAREAGQPAPAFVPLPAAPPAANAGIAAQVFAAAITTAATDPAPFDRVSEAAILFNGQARTEQQTTVQAMSGASQAPLDMTRDDWTGQMIERIAALRDSAEAADTRIKLAPENLGALEVSIRRDGDRIHVHFTADNPAARQLIADAAPRLAELADARGVKLGQTSVDGGSQQGAQRDAQQQQQRGPGRNASVAHRAEPASDDRIA
jgi:flagellar hook-length control protein FliK